MNIEDKVLTIDNKRYVVIETVDLDDKKYAYLVNADDESEEIFREVFLAGDLKVSTIETELFKQKIYPLFVEKFKNY